MKKRMGITCLAAILAFAFIPGCTSVDTAVTAVQTKIESVDWVKLTEGSITAVSTLEKLGKVGIGLSCKFGVLDQDVCALYTLADNAAVPAIAKAKAALAAYKADPSAGNESVLKAAYEILVSTWETYNQAQDSAALATTTTTEATSADPTVSTQ